MVEKFLNAVDDAVASEFLFGARTDQLACFVLVLLLLNLAAVLRHRHRLVGVGHEVIIDDLFLNHLLGIQRAHGFFKSHSRVGLAVGERGERFENSLHHRAERRYCNRAVLETSFGLVKELARVAEDKSIVYVGGYKVQCLFKWTQETTANCLRHIVAVGYSRISRHGFEIIGIHFVASVGSSCLIGEIAFKLGISEEYAVDEEREVRPEGKYFLSVVMERISHFFNGREDILFEIFIAAKLGAAHI